MDTTKASTYTGDGIFSSTYKVKMADIVVISTYARFRKEIGGHDIVNESSVLYGAQPSSHKKVLYINKSLNLTTPTSDFVPSSKTGYVICGETDDILYLNYYLNIFWSRYNLSSGAITDNKIHTINLSLLKNLEILRNKRIEPYCIYLQKVNNRLEALLNYIGFDDTMKSAIVTCFKTIGDTIMFEMWIPKVFAKYNLSLTEEWIKLVDVISSENDLDTQINLLIKHIFNINSPILDSLNRMKTFGPKIMASALKDVIESITV